MVVAAELKLRKTDNREELPDENCKAFNLCHMLLRRRNSGESSAMFAVADGKAGWKNIAAAEFIDDVQALAKGLIADGLRPREHVALMGRTRYEWTLLDFAIMFAGGVPVPIYETSSVTQVAWYLKDSGATRIFIETPQHHKTVKQALALEKCVTIKNVIEMDAESLDNLRTTGKPVNDLTLKKRFNLASSDDAATIIYTSGTTGNPHGCVLSHENFFRLSQNVISSIPDITAPNMRALLFLPLAHVFARFITVACILAGVQIAHTPDTRNILKDIQSYRPNFLLSVPRVLEKIFARAQARAEKKNMGKVFTKAFEAAVDYSQAHPKAKKTLSYRIYEILVYSKIRRSLGNRINFMVSGGAPLSGNLGHFFRGAGITVLEGYGLTETTAPVALNTLIHNKIGTVGRPLPGNTVKISGDGEIYVKGVCVMKGYYNHPGLTSAAFEDGWFKTGDLGKLDDDGFLWITGRKKEIIITAGGKNINPIPIEERLRAHPLVSQAVIFGDRKPFITALITLDEQATALWTKRKGFSAAEKASGVKQEIQHLVDKTNAHFSRAEAVKKFHILENDFSETSGHLTPSLKIKRHNIFKDYADLIDRMYNH